MATEGIEKLTVRKVSRGCGLSDPYIYQCYDDLPDLMRSAFLEIDEMVSRKISSHLKTEDISADTPKEIEKVCWNIWSEYWDFLMEEPERTIFYWRYFQSGFFTRELMLKRRENFKDFIAFMNFIGKKTGISSIADPEIIISNIIDSTIAMVVKIHLGFVDVMEDTKITAFYTVHSALFRLFKMEPEAEERAEAVKQLK